MKTQCARINDYKWGYAYTTEGIIPSILDGYKPKMRLNIIVYETEDKAGHKDGLHRG